MSFFNNIFWKIKRAIILLLIFSLIVSVIYVVIIVRAGSKVTKFSAIIDADTGNGVADLLAIARALADPGFKVIGLMRHKGQQWDFLIDRWQKKFPDKKELIISDVALIEAILKPSFVKEEQTITPPENKSRKVYVYTLINKEFMKIDYWKAIKKYISDNT